MSRVEGRALSRIINILWNIEYHMIKLRCLSLSLDHILQFHVSHGITNINDITVISNRISAWLHLAVHFILWTSITNMRCICMWGIDFMNWRLTVYVIHVIHFSPIILALIRSYTTTLTTAGFIVSFPGSVTFHAKFIYGWNNRGYRICLITWSGHLTKPVYTFL